MGQNGFFWHPHELRKVFRSKFKASGVGSGGGSPPQKIDKMKILEKSLKIREKSV